MILNIETRDAEYTRDLIQQTFADSSVVINHKYGSTADFEIIDGRKPDGVFQLDSLIELAGDLGINTWQIRIH